MSFIAKLEQFLKDNNVSSLDGVYYNNPEKVAEYQKACAEYAEKHAEFLEANPEPKGIKPVLPARWGETDRWGAAVNCEYTSDGYRFFRPEDQATFDAHRAWEDNEPQKPDLYSFGLVHNYEDDPDPDEINVGIWYLSRC